MLTTEHTMNKVLLSLFLLAPYSLISQTPGGVSSSVNIWLKANSGTTGTTNVTQWNDNSGNGFNATATTGPELISNDINYNPTLSFNGSSEYMQVVGGIFGGGTKSHMFTYIVNKTTNVQNSSIFFESLSGGDRFGSHVTWGNSNVYYDLGTCCGASRINVNWGTSTGNYHIWTLGTSTSTSTPAGKRKAIYRDGLKLQDNNNNDTGTGAGSNFFIGSGNGVSSFHSGDIAEMIVLDAVPTATEQQQIHSYLAVKYGIGLDQSTATDYLASDASVIYAATTTHSSYLNDIAGIGRDDNSALDQQQSISASSDARVIMDKGSAFSTDKDFIVWGNDGGSLTTTTTNRHPSYLYLVDRTWKVDVTGTPGSVTLDIILGGGIANSGNVADYALVIDNADSDFSSGATLHTAGGTIIGDTLRYTGVNFTDGDHFTLATDLVTVAPGGVGNNVWMWLKADAGVTGTTNVTGWTDQVNSFSAAATSGPEKLDARVNYNPSLQFNGSSEEMNVTNGIYNGANQPDMFVYVINSTNNVQGSSAFRESLSGGDRFGVHLTWSDQVIYYDHGTCCGSSRINVNWGANTDEFHLYSLASSTSTSTPSGTRKAIYKDGTLLTSNNNNDSGTGANNDFYIGSAGGSSYHAGEIAEFAVYNGIPTATEHQQIETYFGLKYGLTLGHDYISPSGATLWDVTANAAYTNDMAGIGRDDAAGYDQRQSISLNFDAIVTIANGSVASSNQANTNSFGSNSSYLIWGNDNGAIENTGSTDLPTGINGRIDRSWKVEESGTIGTVRIQFDMSNVLGPTGAGSNDLQYVRLLVDSDGTFGTGAVVISPVSYDNTTDIVSFDHDFADGRFIFSLGTVNILGAPLPVELLEFNAVANGDQVQINWATATEINNDYFTIEKSKDGKVWEEFMKVNGAGNSSQMIEYFEVDYNPYNGVSYYRLKQTDFDGTETTMGPIAVKIEEQLVEFQVYPNPSESLEDVNLNLEGMEGKDVLIVLRDIKGNEVYSKALVNENNHQVVLKKSDLNLPPGTYLIMATSADQFKSSKLIIK